MSFRRRILILFAHPALQRSRVQRVLARAVQELEGVTFHDLYEAYPDFDIQVKHEQLLLLEHDLYVMQHPFYWYSTPAILKEWQDLVLEHGWAYGKGGTALHGKEAMTAVSAGGSEEAYCAEGKNERTVRRLLAPIDQTFRLCGVDYLPPFVIHGTHLLGEPEIAAHAADYRRVILALRDGTADLKAAREQEWINCALDEVAPRQEG